MRHGMMIDLDLCVGCKACVSACKEQWDTGPGAARPWVDTYETGTRANGDLAVTFYPGLCMQCEEHPCTVDCPTGATRMDERGVVVVDADLCIGCGNCVSSCAYGARHVDPVKKIVEKCNLCSPFVARGEEPACVQTCPAEARVFGDLDDPGGKLAETIAARGAKPLAVPGIDVKPKNTYAGELKRERILAEGVVHKPEKSWLTKTWGVTLPATRTGVPAIGAVAVAGGMLVNLKARIDRVRAAEQGGAPAAPAAAQPARIHNHPPELDRHPAGLRFLHWFNATSWLVLVLSGVGLMTAARFAFFGQRFPAAVAHLVGGKDDLIRLHVYWGLVWALTIVPLFLLFKGSLRHVWEDIRVTRDDVVWLVAKPIHMAGLWKNHLPPQDKYNAGQKVFAVFVLIATATIIASGFVMTFHLATAAAVATAILVHKLAIALVLVGLAIHLTMAAVIADERPALKSMITGRIEYHHAKHHSPKWVEKLRSGAAHGADASKGKEDGK